METADHIFIDWPYVISTWLGVNINVVNVLNDFGDFHGWVISWFSAGPQQSGVSCSMHLKTLYLITYVYSLDNLEKYIFFDISKYWAQQTVTIAGINSLVNDSLVGDDIVVRNVTMLQLEKWKPPDAN